MRIESRGSFLDVSVSHGLFNMKAQVKLVNLLIGYAILALIFAIRWYRKHKNSEAGPIR
jgi:hypothetical protein